MSARAALEIPSALTRSLGLALLFRLLFRLFVTRHRAPAPVCLASPGAPSVFAGTDFQSPPAATQPLGIISTHQRRAICALMVWSTPPHPPRNICCLTCCCGFAACSLWRRCAGRDAQSGQGSGAGGNRGGQGEETPDAPSTHAPAVPLHGRRRWQASPHQSWYGFSRAPVQHPPPKKKACVLAKRRAARLYAAPGRKPGSIDVVLIR